MAIASLMANDANGRPIQALALGTVHNKSYTGTAGTIDNPISATCSNVVVCCSTAAHIAFGDSPTATTDDIRVAAGTWYFLKVPKPGVSKVSAVQQSSGGVLQVVEMM